MELALNLQHFVRIQQKVDYVGFDALTWELKIKRASHYAMPSRNDTAKIGLHFTRK